MLIVNDNIAVPLREFTFTFARSSGPGGQHVNKVNTKATLRWSVRDSAGLSNEVRTRFEQRYSRRITQSGDLIITSQRFRDRGRNVADCLGKLREMLLSVANAPTPRKKTRPTAGATRRRRRDKESTSRKKLLRKPPRPDD